MTKYVCKYTDFVLFDNTTNKSEDINGSVYKISSTKCDGNEPGTTTYEVCKKFDYYNHAFTTVADMTNYFTYYTHKLFIALKSKDEVAAAMFKANMKCFQEMMEEKFDKLRFFINDTWDVNGLVIMVEEHVGGSGTLYYIKEGIRTE